MSYCIQCPHGPKVPRIRPFPIIIVKVDPKEARSFYALSLRVAPYTLPTSSLVTETPPPAIYVEQPASLQIDGQTRE